MNVHPLRSKPLTLLACIPEGDAAALLQRLSAVEIKRLANKVPDELLLDHSVPDELLAELRTSETSDASCDTEISPIESRDLVTDSDPVALAALLQDELPQTVAAVVKQLTARQAAAVLARLSTRLQLAVTRRLASSDETSPDVLLDVCSSIANRTQARGTRPLLATGGPIMVARMLDRMDDATERALIENLAQEDPILLERIRDLQTLFRSFRLARFIEGRDEAQAA